MDIDLKQLKELMRALKQFDITEVVLEKEGERIKLRRGADGTAQLVHPPPHLTLAPPPSTQAALPSGMAPLPASTETPVEEGTFITSPFVGTFYQAPSPKDPAFVSVGASVKAGQTLCIVEAMKLMNEIEAEFPCTILEVLAENGKPVEYGQRLFRVKKA